MTKLVTRRRLLPRNPDYAVLEKSKKDSVCGVLEAVDDPPGQTRQSRRCEGKRSFCGDAGKDGLGRYRCRGWCSRCRKDKTVIKIKHLGGKILKMYVCRG